MSPHIQQKIQNVHEEVIAIRRHLHAHPELSFVEYKTSEFIQQKLKSWGVSYKTGVAGTGVVAFIEGKSKRCIALRADMDALPIQELNELPYKSQNAGIMHACGHDVHTSILLGTAKILNEIREELPVSVKLIFQPGEEKLPGGASLMISEGVLENPTVEAIYALHVFPEMEVGKVGLRAGKYMASCDELYIEILGKGGHAAMPAHNIDPIKLAAKVITAFEDIQENQCPKDVPCVLAVGRIEGLGATNVIPDKVTIQGTFRTMDETWRNRAHELIHQSVSAICDAAGARASVKIEKGYPYLENNHDLTQSTTDLLTKAFGKENVVEIPQRMTAEDFSFYAQKIPAVFMRLGVRNEAKGIVHAVHNARFDADESSFLFGIQIFVKIALNR